MKNISIKVPNHVAIIMDGNGRWAMRRGLPRIRGHEEGAKAVRSVVRKAREVGIRYLTLFAFSSQNWERPPDEVEGLMYLLDSYLLKEGEELVEKGIRLLAIGEVERLPASTTRVLKRTMEMTSRVDEMTLILALSYGGKEEILRAVRDIASDVERGELRPREIDPDTFVGYLYTRGVPDPDLLIRTSGEMRMSNFLLFQTAYTEFYVTRKLWPDFRGADLMKALKEYSRRGRRFGRISPSDYHLHPGED